MFNSIWFYVVLCFMSVAAVLLFFTGASRSEREENEQWCQQHPDDCAPSEHPTEVTSFTAEGPIKSIQPEEPEKTPDVSKGYGANQITIPLEISPETAEILKSFLRAGKSTVHKIYVTCDGETRTYTTNAGHMKASNTVRAEEAKRRAIATKQIIDSGYTEDRAADDMGYGSVKSMRQAIKKYCGGTK